MSPSSSSFEDPSVSFDVTHPLVLLQMAIVEKCFPTQITHEGFGGTMTKHVCFQLVVLNEALATHLTGEGFFTCVNTNVPFQVLLEGETRAAGLARERFSSVNGLVRSEGPPQREGFVTHATFERMLTGVASSVTPQGEGVAETPPTLGALVRLLHSVNHLVSLQVAFCFEGLGTGGAHKRPQVSVNNLMGL